VDARDTVIGEGRNGWVCCATESETAGGRYHDRLLRKARVLKRDRPAESLRWRWCSEERGVLRDTEWLGGGKTWRCWAIVEAVKGVESVRGGHETVVKCCWEFWGRDLSRRCSRRRWSWIESVCGVETSTA
jgi:hypothetical protein